MNGDQFHAAAGVLRDAQRVVVFTGAGVSAESGIATFRDAGGFWQRFPPERFATWSGLMAVARREPKRLAEFLLALIGPIAAARPNAAHAAIARLEALRPTTVITQNIDELHQESGSTTVREIHGTLFDVVKSDGRFVRRVSRDQLEHMAGRLRAAMEGRFALLRLVRAIRPLAGLSLTRVYRPRIVLFGEAMAEPDWTNAQADARACDVMLVIGTSGLVWPAGGLPLAAKRGGAKVIHVDPEPSEFADVCLPGAAADVVPRLVESAFGSER